MNRRKFVMAGIGGLSFLSGCTGNNNSDGNPDTDNSDDNSETDNSESQGNQNEADSSEVFQNIGIEGTTLVVELKEDTGVGLVRIVDSEGSQVTQLGFGAGVTRVTKEVTETVDVEWEFVAINSGESIESITKTFAPEFKITDISREADSENMALETFDNSDGEFVNPILGLNTYAVETYKNMDPQDGWDSDFTKKFTHVAVSCENTGSSPLFLTDNPKFIEGTPYTWNDPEGDRDQDIQIVIPPGESKSIRSDYPVLEFVVKPHPVQSDGYVFDKRHSAVTSPDGDFPEDQSTGEPKTTTFYFEDDTGNRYEQSASITLSGPLVQLAYVLRSRKYVPTNVEMTLET